MEESFGGREFQAREAVEGKARPPKVGHRIWEASRDVEAVALHGRISRLCKKCVQLHAGRVEAATRWIAVGQHELRAGSQGETTPERQLVISPTLEADNVKSHEYDKA